MSGTTTNTTLDGLLRDFVERVADVQAVAVASTDGMHKHSYGIDDVGDADQVSAVSSGLFSLAKGADRLFPGSASMTARQVIVEVGSGLYFVTSPAEGALLTVLARHEANLGLIGYEMNMLGQSIGPSLRTAPRTAAAG
ncbi:roadblock/LC7 domain-containing protein [Streptomyces phaeochromogenes]|uniref:roadblock/LC7 domain-containing protein n=1 Tax=Streptomyces phaeochromogenes TaxID=1923 RepID=UPI0033DAB3B4